MDDDGSTAPGTGRYLDNQGWDSARRERMIKGLRALQEIARTTNRLITYGKFAEKVQPPLATAAVLGDIGNFCNAVEWPNVTCFVISATTGSARTALRRCRPMAAVP